MVSAVFFKMLHEILHSSLSMILNTDYILVSMQIYTIFVVLLAYLSYVVLWIMLQRSFLFFLCNMFFNCIYKIKYQGKNICYYSGIKLTSLYVIVFNNHFFKSVSIVLKIQMNFFFLNEFQ